MERETGKSLLCAYLRQIKDCQIVQTDWKPSFYWEIRNVNELEELWNATERFREYGIFRRDTSLNQFLKRGRTDLMGISVSGNSKIYAVETEFRENELRYGDTGGAVAGILERILRTAMYMRGYFDTKQGEIIFASPAIYRDTIYRLNSGISVLEKMFREKGYEYQMVIVTNEEFSDTVDSVFDTSEPYTALPALGNVNRRASPQRRMKNWSPVEYPASVDSLSGLKIGEIAKTYLILCLENGAADEREVLLMQDKEYSKRMFDIDYPLLARVGGDFKWERYYTTRQFEIGGIDYFLCSQWFEGPANNDRPYLMSWLKKHGCLK